MIKIDLGCGCSRKQGFTGVDTVRHPCVDVVHDLNSFPYPFADAVADEVWMDNVLEHLKEPVTVMEEVWRVACHGARVTVSVPFFRSVYSSIDPTHRTFFSSQWFSYFDPEHLFCKKYGYSTARFKVERIQYDRERSEAGCMGLVRSLLVRFAERHPFWYELKLSHLYPLDSLTFHLTVIKKQTT